MKVILMSAVLVSLCTAALASRPPEDTTAKRNAAPAMLGVVKSTATESPCDNMLYYGEEPVPPGTTIEMEWTGVPPTYSVSFSTLEARGMYDLEWTSSPPGYDFIPDKKQSIYKLWENGIYFSSATNEVRVCTTFTVRGKYVIEDSNLVINDDFSAGNTGFTSEYTDMTDEYNNHAHDPLMQESTFCVGEDAYQAHSGFQCDGGHGGSNTNVGVPFDKFMIVNADTTGKRVWCETVYVEKDSEYVFRAWVNTISEASLNTPANLKFTANNDSIGHIVAPVYSGNRYGWRQFYATWKSTTTGEINICIEATTTDKFGNDYGLDDIYFGKSFSEECERSITLCAKGENSSDECMATLIPTNVKCNGDRNGEINVTNLQGGNPPYTIKWGNASDQSVSGINTTSYPITGLAADDYNVTVADATGIVCTQMTITITEPPPLQVTLNATPEAICNGNETTLETTPEGMSGYHWESDPTNSEKPAEGQSSGRVEPTENTTYHVTVTDANGCTASAYKSITMLPTQKDTFRDTICGETLRNTGYTWSRAGIGSGRDRDTLIEDPGIYHYTIPGSQAKSAGPARSTARGKSGVPATVTHVEMNDAMPAVAIACPVAVVTGPGSDGTRKKSPRRRQSGDYYLTIMPCKPGQRIRLEVVEYYSATESSYLEIYGGTRATGTPVRLGKETAVPALVIDGTDDVSGAFTLHAHVKDRKKFNFRIVAAGQ